MQIIKPRRQGFVDDFQMDKMVLGGLKSGLFKKKYLCLFVYIIVMMSSLLAFCLFLI